MSLFESALFATEVANATKTTRQHSLHYSENKSEFRINNVSGVTVEIIHIDGGIPSLIPYKKVDFGVTTPGNSMVWYIELKGARIPHGIEQLKETLSHFAHVHKQKVAKTCVLIATRIPKFGTGFQKEQKIFRTLGANFEQAHLAHTISIL